MFIDGIQWERYEGAWHTHRYTLRDGRTVFAYTSQPKSKDATVAFTVRAGKNHNGAKQDALASGTAPTVKAALQAATKALVQAL